MYCLCTAGDSCCNLFTTREDDVENNDPDDSSDDQDESSDDFSIDPSVCACYIFVRHNAHSFIVIFAKYYVYGVILWSYK